MDPEIRYHACQLRAEGRVLTGTAMPYGTIADIGGLWRERFEPGAFGDVTTADVILNAAHDRTTPLARSGGAQSGGNLVLVDTPAALTFRASMPPTRAAEDVLALVAAGVLRGASVEFVPTEEQEGNGVRIISRAKLYGIAIVDRPAYPDAAVAARWRDRARQRGPRRRRIHF